MPHTHEFKNSHHYSSGGYNLHTGFCTMCNCFTTAAEQDGKEILYKDLPRPVQMLVMAVEVGIKTYQR